MTDLDRKILAKACGVCWHNLWDKYGYRRLFCPLCGKQANKLDHPDFDTPDDWELVRAKVVVPNLDDFAEDFYLLSLYGWLLESPKELCQLAVDWIKSCPDLFPWVAEFIAEIAEKQLPSELTQITSGNGMPWEDMEKNNG